jgi:hypothetical protein
MIGRRMSEKMLPNMRKTMVIGIPVGSRVNPPNSGMSVRRGIGSISSARIIAANMASIAILWESVLTFKFFSPNQSGG